MEKYNEFIIDTDIGNDCDDAGALAILNNLMDKYNIKVLGIGSSSSLKEGAYCTNIINEYYNHKIETGYYDKKGFYDHYDHKIYSEIVSNEFPHKNDVKTYEQVLKEAFLKATDKITLVILGPMHAFMDFLMKDDNLKLVNEKTKHVYIMGGKFCSYPVYYEGKEVTKEWNITEYIKGAKYVVNNLKVPTTFVPFETGLILTGTNLKANSPVKRSYEVFSGKERFSWDPITMYYAITKDNVNFVETNKGDVTILDDGTSLFKENESGRFTILNIKSSKEEVRDLINSILV